MLKSDIKAAYRSLPLAGSDLGLASVLLRNPGGQLFIATQLAMPFGAVASVYAWDRLGAALAAILQEFLLIPCVRYVDDLFWVDFVAASAECRLAALECIDLLGFTLEESKTLAPSSCQTVLGIKVALVDNGVSLQYSPEPMKAALWVEEVSRTLKEGDVDLVGLRKLTGRLSFAAWAMWGPAARCHLGGLHQQVRLWKAPLLLQAISDLEWWARELRFPQQEPVLIYTDASGSGGLGAVFVGSTVRWVSGTVPTFLRQHLKARRTQICIYEALMVVCAARIFARSSMVVGQCSLWTISLRWELCARVPAPAGTCRHWWKSSGVKWPQLAHRSFSATCPLNST